MFSALNVAALAAMLGHINLALAQSQGWAQCKLTQHNKSTS